jgi:hypothetical protein
MVELYPGYPEYRGYVTGVAGPGEGACLDELESNYERFSRQSQDRANRTAARHQGISGTPADWTWENWMAIEAERNLDSVCYSCEYANWAKAPKYSEISVDDDDPRLLAGLFGEKYVARRFVSENGLAAFETENLPTDDALRAIVGMVYSPDVFNASDLIDAENEFLQYFKGLKKVNGSYAYFDATSLYHNLVDRGGYVDTPDNATAFDQFYTIGEGIYSLYYFGLEPSAHEYMINQSQQVWNQWQADPQGESFAEYFRDIGARNWL